jgi:branched-chain amino acid transport system ATP-binding protein
VSQAVLEIRGLDVYAKSAHILQEVSLVVGDEPTAIIGRNGMGKTTLCDTLFGLRVVRNGSITYCGHELRGLRPHQISRFGLAYGPQGRRLFAHLTARENLSLAFNANRKDAAISIKDVLDLFPPLVELQGRQARSLSGGEQQMVAIGRAMLTQPTLLVLDEPSEGLAPVIVESMVKALRTLSESGTRLLLVEQNLRVAAALAERLAVMVNGRFVETVRAEQFLEDTAAQERLLGLQT